MSQYRRPSLPPFHSPWKGCNYYLLCYVLFFSQGADFSMFFPNPGDWVESVKPGETVSTLLPRREGPLPWYDIRYVYLALSVVDDHLAKISTNSLMLKVRTVQQAPPCFFKIEVVNNSEEYKSRTLNLPCLSTVQRGAT